MKTLVLMLITAMLCLRILHLEAQLNMARGVLVEAGAAVEEVLEVIEPVAEPEPETVAVKVTAYCACVKCCEKDADGRTAWWRGVSRGYANHRGAAVAPKLIPYGTWLDIPGYGRVQVDDTGGAMRQAARKGITHIDLRFNTHSEALAWGVQYLDIPTWDSK